MNLAKAVRKKYENFIDIVLSNSGLGKYCGSNVAVVPCFGTFRDGEFLTRANDTRIRILY